MTHRDLDEPFGPQLQEISEVLRDLRSVNHLAQECLHLMELDGVGTLSGTPTDRA